MDCPICGEQIPLNARECAECGHTVDRFFLSEEVDTSRVRKRVMDSGAPRKEPSALKPSRPPLSDRKMLILGAAAVVVVVIIIIVVFLVTRGHGGAGSPEDAVRGYYDALQNRDFDGMLQYVAAGFQPTGNQKVEIRDAVIGGSWQFSDLNMRTMSGAADSVSVILNDLNATVRCGPKGEEKLSLVTDVIQPMQQQSPGSVIVVNVVNDGGVWKIAGRPLGGWAAENLWVIGEAAKP